VRANAPDVLARNAEQSESTPRVCPCCRVPALSQRAEAIGPWRCASGYTAKDGVVHKMQWRVGAFEVMNEGSGELLFSKLMVGQYTSPKNDGSRPPEEERAASVALEVLLVRA
jgi:hypothetical protein